MQSKESEKDDYFYNAFFTLVSHARQIDSSAQKRYEGKGKKTNLNQLGIMHFLTENNAASQLEIAEFISRDAATVTRILDKMTRDGLVVRAQNIDDRRKWKVSLTNQGEQVYQELRAKSESIITASFKDILKVEVQQMLNTLDQISYNIKI